MIMHRIARLALGVALAGCSAAWAVIPSSANYKMPASTLNSGVGNMSSASFKLSSSLGDSAFFSPLSSAAFKLSPGFWYAVRGLAPSCLLDVDGNGAPNAVQPFVDGILIVRNMLGITTDPSMTQGLTIPGPNNTAALLAPIFAARNFDSDGSGSQQAFVDGIILVRLMLGVPDATLLNGITLPPAATFLTAAAIRANVNARCGTAF